VHNGQELQKENSESKAKTGPDDKEQVYFSETESPDPASKSVEAQQSELADWTHAMRESKEELLERGVPLSSDGVVILRLTKRARAPEVLEAPSVMWVHRDQRHFRISAVHTIHNSSSSTASTLHALDAAPISLLLSGGANGFRKHRVFPQEAI
jgi:hypothetical protein